jgi:hypothetical protein
MVAAWRARTSMRRVEPQARDEAMQLNYEI